MLLWIILAVLSQLPQEDSLTYVPDAQPDEKNYIGKWALRYFCSSKNDQVGKFWLGSPYNYNVKNALEKCADICDEMNCFFANLVRGNQFECILLKDCSELVSTNNSIYLENGRSLYQKGLNYKATGIWAKNFYCTSEKQERMWRAVGEYLITDNEAWELCALKCEESNWCVFANLKRDEGFTCFLLKDCRKLLSTNSVDLYQKEIRIPDLRCTFDTIIETHISVSIGKGNSFSCASGCVESD